MKHLGMFVGYKTRSMTFKAADGARGCDADSVS